MITREEYMKDSENLHHAYYLQFSKSICITLTNWIISNWSIDTIRECFNEDKNLNNLPGDWMRIMDNASSWTKGYIGSVNKKTTGQSTFSYSDNVCMIKARMKEIIKESTK